MEYDTNFQEERSEEYRPLNLENVDSDLSYMETLLKELANRAGVLPKADKDGSSECPFAEDLYAAKESAENNVTEQLKKLQGNLGPLNKEISGCKRNLELIQADSNHLHIEEARQNYSYAEGSLEAYYEKAIDLKEQMIVVIARTEEELRKAGEKKWPLGTPKGKSYAPWTASNTAKDLGGQDFYGPAPLSPSYMNGSLNKEIDSLMALGPLGGPVLGQSFF